MVFYLLFIYCIYFYSSSRLQVQDLVFEFDLRTELSALDFLFYNITLYSPILQLDF